MNIHGSPQDMGKSMAAIATRAGQRAVASRFKAGKSAVISDEKGNTYLVSANDERTLIATRTETAEGYLVKRLNKLTGELEPSHFEDDSGNLLKVVGDEADS